MPLFRVKAKMIVDYRFTIVAKDQADANEAAEVKLEHLARGADELGIMDLEVTQFDPDEEDEDV